MAEPRDARIKLENELRERLRDAEAIYKAAKREHERLAEIVKDLGPNHPDGSTALKHAVQNGRTALAAYEAALKNFTNLTLKLQLPPKS
jgi:hypothetical protein